MNNVLGIINVTQEDAELHPLTSRRCQASIPYGGRYRLIDFILSSMVQSQIKNVAIFTPYNYQSLQNHLGSGKDWDLEYKQEGLFIFPRNIYSPYNEYGDLSVLHQHLDYLEKSTQEYVLIAFGSLIMNIDFRPVIKQHIQSDANVTVVYKEKSLDDHTYTNIKVDDFYNVISFNELESKYGSLDIFVIDKDTLITFIKTYTQPYRNLLDILKHCDFNWKVKGYEYKGRVQKVNSASTYYHANMELLDPCFSTKLLTTPNEIYTKLKDEPPCKYNKSAVIKNSLVSNGCVVEGEVENSILFQGVHVEKGSTIRNSIVLPNCHIGKGSLLEMAIVDKGVSILPFENIKGSLENPRVITEQKNVEAHLHERVQ